MQKVYKNIAFATIKTLQMQFILNSQYSILLPLLMFVHVFAW